MRLLLFAFVVLLAGTAPAQGPKPTELRFGSEPWHLALSLGDLKPIQGYPSRPGRDVFTYSNERLFVLSVIVENARQPATLASCGDVFARRKAAARPLNETQSRRGDAAIQEYDVKLEFQGETMVQHHVYSCRARGTYYIDLHASKMRYRSADRAALFALIDRVAIID